MRKFPGTVMLISFLLASCGTLEIEFDKTSTPVVSSPTAAPTSDQTQPTPEPTTTGCSNDWFFTFNDKHTSLGKFCPAPVKVLDAVGEDFEGGRAYRYAPDPDYATDQRGTVYVIYNDGEWVTFPDTWDSSQPSYDPNIAPPQGRYQPVESIGKVWRDNSDVRQRLGWAYEEQSAFQGRVQSYLAQADLPSGDTHYTFIDHGKWGLVLLLNSVDMGPNTWEVAGSYK